MGTATQMMSETLLSLAEAARRLPPGRLGRPVSASTLFRWIVAGLRVADGRTVRLQAIKIGGRWLTSAEALTRFAAALTPSLDSSVESAGHRRQAVAV
jgi:hypothetical protein